jgi:hypothetical protein
MLIDLLRPPPRSWPAYMAALQQCDQYQRLRGLSIFENMEQQKSWAETILTGNRIIRTHHTWNRHDIDVLIGLHTIDENWGLLGNMGARGNAANTLNEKQDDLRQILRSLFNISDAEEFKRAAVKAIKDIGDIPNIGIGIATRLITLTRPDYAVSVNTPAAMGFSALYNNGLPKTRDSLGNDNNYPKLLQHIYDQGWFKAPEPQDQHQRILWSMRSALLDAFVYEDFQRAQQAEQETARLKRQAEQATRPGQQQFSAMLRENYRGTCAVTGCNTSAVLEAAHIRLIEGVDGNSPQNGLLLRSDIHALFDALLITLSEDGATVEISQVLTDPTYAFLKNVPVMQPTKRPSSTNIQEHRKRFFEKEKERSSRDTDP